MSQPSRRLRSAAAAEVTRVDRALAKVTARERALAAELATVTTEREALERDRQTLIDLAGRDAITSAPEPAPAPRLRAVPAVAGTVLRGAQIRMVAVRLLTEHADADTAIHYRDWYALFVAQGHMAGGKDPLATFLTQITRSPVVCRSTVDGVYSLDAGFIGRARVRRTQLITDLAVTHDLTPHADGEEIATARTQRDRLTRELHALERDLGEALRVLAPNGDERTGVA